MNSSVLRQINETFGAGLNDCDRLEVEKTKQTLLEDSELRNFA
jgi:hypothetical protein